jgi:peptide/nickel transport system substrate-binding protein
LLTPCHDYYPFAQLDGKIEQNLGGKKMSAKKRLYLLFSLLVIAALLLAACGGPGEEVQPPAGEGEEPAAPAEGEEEMPPEERKVAIFIWTQEFDTLNNYYSNMWFQEITDQMWLVWPWQFDENNDPYPVLVTEIPSADNGGISADDKTLTLTLRDDIIWSDGTPITSADFVFTHEMVMNPANTVATTYPNDQIESITAPDDRTVVITFSEPFVPWAATLFHTILPKHVLEPVFESEGTIDNAEWNLNPTVGCGPFVFAEWESGSFARFIANENYWGEPPQLDEIFIRFVPDDAAQINALLAGEGDLGTFFSYSDVPDLEAAGVKIYAVQSGYNEGWYMLISEEGHPALMDVRVRQAIAMAFDRASLADDLLLGLTKPAVTYWDNTPYANPDLEPWPYDPDRANTLLDEAGWVDSNGDGVRDKDGVELVLTYGTTTREVRQDTQAVAQQQLAAVGVGLDLQNYDSDLFFAVDGPAALGEMDIMEWSDTTEFPDPSISYWLISEIPTEDYPVGLNWQRINDEELDDLFQLQQTQVDFAERQATFWEISKQVYEKVYWLGIWQDPDLFGVNERLTNVKLSGATPFFNIAEWDLVE